MMPRKKTTDHISNALVTPAKSSAKKPSKLSIKDCSPLSSLNSSSDRDEFGKLLKSVKSKIPSCNKQKSMSDGWSRNGRITKRLIKKYLKEQCMIWNVK